MTPINVKQTSPYRNPHHKLKLQHILQTHLSDYDEVSTVLSIRSVEKKDLINIFSPIKFENSTALRIQQHKLT